MGYLEIKAASYAGSTGFDAATVAAFLARIMRERRISSPREIHMAVIRDHYLRTRDGDELCVYAAPRRTVTLTENGIRAEEAILARQEIY